MDISSYRLDKEKFSLFYSEHMSEKRYAVCFTGYDDTVTSYDDISVLGDGSVRIWLVPDITVFIAYISTNKPEQKVILDGGTCSHLFEEKSHIEKIDLSYADTSSATDMSFMFANCEGLWKVNFSGIDTSRVTDMSNMFNGCDVLAAPDLSGFDTRRVTNMKFMFAQCFSMEELDLSSFRTSRVHNMQAMFSECNKLKKINISSFRTSQVTNMASMFCECYQLKSVDVSRFNTHKVTNMMGMFQECMALPFIDVSGFDMRNVINIESMFAGCYELEKIDISGWEITPGISVAHLFAFCSRLPYVDLSCFTEVKNVAGMFWDCQKMKTIDISQITKPDTLGMDRFLQRNRTTDISVNKEHLNERQAASIGSWLFYALLLYKADRVLTAVGRCDILNEVQQKGILTIWECYAYDIAWNGVLNLIRTGHTGTVKDMIKGFDLDLEIEALNAGVPAEDLVTGSDDFARDLSFHARSVDECLQEDIDEWAVPGMHESFQVVEIAVNEVEHKMFLDLVPLMRD